MSVVRIENLSKLYGSAVALRHLDLEVRTGEWVTLLGPSGCGKTTTLRMVAGFAAPTTGKITIGSRVVSDPAAGVMVPIERRRLGMVFQAYAVWPHMDVLGNVSYPLHLRKLPRAQREERAQRALAQVRLEEFASRYPHELSGGQQQRVALARALVSDPEVLLLDEPLSALDARLREELRGLLAQLHRETGLTVIFVTHDQDEAIALSDRIVVMNLGEVKQVGSPQEIYSRPVDEFVAGFVGTASLLPVEVQAGRALLAGRPIRTAALKEGGRTAVIRPENVRVHDRGALDGRVLHAWYRGDHFLIALDTPAGQLLARAAEAPGSGTVRLDVEDCVVV